MEPLFPVGYIQEKGERLGLVQERLKVSNVAASFFHFKVKKAEDKE